MRVMVLVPASEQSEAGILPTTEEFAEMGAFNEELVKAGVLLAADGLKPSSAGKKVRFDEGGQTVLDGPFAEAKELVAGFWIWEVASMDEAIEWLKRAPFGGGVELQIRPIFSADDFGDNLTPELRTAEDRMRAESGQA